MAKYLKPPYNSYTPNRKNPPYPPGYCFTTVKCEKCGEHYEPICICEHICKKQNSYPGIYDITDEEMAETQESEDKE